MKVVLNKYEVNGFHDSDFFACVFDTESKKIERVLIGTTRAGFVGDPLEGMRDATIDEKTEASIIAGDDYERERRACNRVKIGDKVRVVKGIKIARGTEFIVTRIQPFKDRYGRIKTIYVCGDGVSTSVDNVIII
jgi:hypothetical protein